MLGRGGIGTVYDGWDPVIGRRVAVKTVGRLDIADDEMREGLERFKREAQAAGRLSHPNIVSVYDYGETDQTAYIVMEYVQGQSLKQRLDQREQFPVIEIVRIMEQVLEALQFSHKAAVIHRDIKPGNVMITAEGRVKLADFGIARIESSVMTQDGTRLGTPAYMSPEQLMAKPVDARSDIYSAGVLLYQLLTGVRPFEGDLTAIIHKALNTVPSRPSEISVAAPASLDPVVARAMSKRPADRYPSAAAFAAALREAFDARDPVPRASSGAGWDDDDPTNVVVSRRANARSTPAFASVVGGARRRNLALIGGAAACLVLLLGAGVWLALRPSALQTRQLASAASSQSLVSPAQTSEPTAPPPATPPPATPPPATSAPNTPIAAPVLPAIAEPVAVAPAAAPPSAATVPAAIDPSPPPAMASPPASPPPVRTAWALANPAAIRDALGAVAQSTRCALPRFSVSDDGRIDVSGIVGAGAPDAALHQAVLDAAPGTAQSWDERAVDSSYCEALDIIRPIAQPSSPFLALTLKDERTHLKDMDPILPVLKLPEFASHIQVDYFSHDGSVTHLFPAQDLPDRVYKANAIVRFGDPQKGIGSVGPPFGTDMILAVASSVPLFQQPRPSDDETARAYLPALQTAIDTARHHNAKITGRVLPLDTAER